MPEIIGETAGFWFFLGILAAVEEFFSLVPRPLRPNLAPPPLPEGPKTTPPQMANPSTTYDTVFHGQVTKVT